MARLPKGAPAVAALVVAAFVALGALSYAVEDPRIFVDEVRYMDAAASVAGGGGLQVRGESYGWAPGYPVLLAPILLVAHDRAAAYAAIKLLDAVLFALAAAPIYLLARTLLSRRTSLVVAALSLAIPSSVYVGLVFTESLAYLLCSTALYAVALAVERPAPWRQLAAIAAIAAACVVRPQFAALYPAFLLAALASVAFAPAARRRARLRLLRPAAASAVVVAAAAATVVLARGASPLGRYSDLWQSYDPVDVARWLVYHVADLALFLGLIPIALLPPVLGCLYRRARAGSAPDAAFLCVFAAANVCVLAVVAAFASTTAGQERLHDRYLFYLVPLWLVAGAVWLRDGAARPARAAAAGAALLLVVVAAFPFDRLVTDESWRQLEAAGTTLWAHLGGWSVGHGVSGHRALALVAAAAAAAAYLAPARHAWTLALPVAAVVVASSALLWRDGIVASHQHVFAGRSDLQLAWVDRAVPAGHVATMVYVPSPRCPHVAYAYELTEFFNDRVGPMKQLGPSGGDLPEEQVDVAADGRLVRPSGRALVADWVLTPRGVAVRGTRAAEGTVERLVLWRVGGVVVVRARSDRDLEAAACSGI
jgi:hypothetical protein